MPALPMTLGALRQAAERDPSLRPRTVKQELRDGLVARLSAGATLDQLFPGTKGAPPPKDPKLQIAELKEQGALARQSQELQARQQEFIMTLMEERRLNNAKIVELYAKADEASANAENEATYAQVAAINAQISIAERENRELNQQIDHMLRAAEIRSRHLIGMKSKEPA